MALTRVRFVRAKTLFVFNFAAAPFKGELQLPPSSPASSQPGQAAPFILGTDAAEFGGKGRGGEVSRGVAPAGVLQRVW